MKSFKKIIVLALVVMLAAAMTVTALAAAGAGTWVASETANSTTTVKQASVWNNEDGITDVSYKVDYNKGANNRVKTAFAFEITAGAAAGASSTAPEIKAGDLTGIKFGTATGVTVDTSSDDKAKLAFAANDANATKDVKVEFDTSAFADTGAGIYRYIITETLTAEQQALGIKSDSATGSVRYMDVYVENGATADAAMKVTNVVMFKTVGQPTLKDTIPEGAADGLFDQADYAALEKVDNFENTIGTKKPDPNDPDPTNPDPDDEFYGYTVTITKTVEGPLGSKTAYFPFTLSLAYTDDTTDSDTSLAGLKVQLSYNEANGTVATNPTELTFGDNNTLSTDAIQLKHGGSVTVKGVPATVVAQVKETIAETEGYTITSTATDFNAGAGITTAVKVETDFVTTGTVIKDDAKSGTFAYTNTRNAISPTGVVMKVAPFASMFAAGIILIAIVRRRKDEVEA